MKYSEEEHLMSGAKKFNDIESKILVICFACYHIVLYKLWEMFFDLLWIPKKK